MAKIRITTQTIAEIFGKYDDCQEEPIECGERIRKYLKDLLATWSVPKTKVDNTMRILETVKQNIREVKLSQEMSNLDPTNTIVSQKRKMDEQNLRLTITKVKEWLNTLIEKQRLETLSLKYAILAAALSAFAGIGATIGLNSFYPLNNWTFGQFTWYIGLVISLIAALYVFKTLRYNSSPTQIIVAVLITPIFAVITTTCIVLAASSLTLNLVMASGGASPEIYFGPQLTLISFNTLVERASTDAILLVALLISVVVGFVLAAISSYLERKVIDLRFFKPLLNEDSDDI
jgi:hypothetical protein